MVEVTDSDFDPVTLDPGSFLVKVIDDIPIANYEDNAEVGGSPVSGNVITGVNSDPDSPGADGLGVIRSLTHDGVTYELNEAGDSISDGTHESPTDGDDLSNFRSEEHTSELQSLMRISYAVFCLKKKKIQ